MSSHLWNSDHLAATVKPSSRPVINFEADVDWRERHQFLKCKSIGSSILSITEIAVLVELPLDINRDVATYETQFGHVQRPTHKNTTWDAAKFEVWGHKVRLCICTMRSE